MKCIFVQSFINALYSSTIYVGFLKIRSAGSDSNCKQLPVYCVSVVDASPKMFNSKSS